MDDLNTDTYSLIQGRYTGTRYRWQRGYDSTHHVVERYDTTYNLTTDLEFDEINNVIKLGGMTFPYHDDLKTLRNKDTILAVRPMGTVYPIRYLYIMPFTRSLFVYEGYSPEWSFAYTIKEYYSKY